MSASQFAQHLLEHQRTMRWVAEKPDPLLYAYNDEVIGPRGSWIRRYLEDLRLWMRNSPLESDD